MAYPDHMDERAVSRFRRGFVGSTHGDDGSNYRTAWDSECDAEPTKMIITSGRPICAYCGHVGFPLQPNIAGKDYDIIGYTCVCKGAMDEEEWRQEMRDMENKHYEEMQQLKRRAPKTNPDALKGVIHALTAQLADAKTLYDVERILENIQRLKIEEGEDF